MATATSLEGVTKVALVGGRACPGFDTGSSGLATVSDSDHEDDDDADLGVERSKREPCVPIHPSSENAVAT